VFFNISKLPQAVMARAALAAKDDTLALNVVVQQLCIGHGSHRLGLETPNSVRLYGQRMGHPRLQTALMGLFLHAARLEIGLQLPVEHWHDIIGDPTIADAILDRLVHNAHRLALKGESLRKVAGKRHQLDDEPAN